VNEAETRAELIDPALRVAGWGVVADTPDDKIVEGEIEEGKRYREPQFNRTIEIEERERYRVRLFMDQIDQREKSR
jgi:type I site-specific restriction endonuclease